jgi:hypothetical protein
LKWNAEYELGCPPPKKNPSLFLPKLLKMAFLLLGGCQTRRHVQRRARIFNQRKMLAHFMDIDLFADDYQLSGNMITNLVEGYTYQLSGNMITNLVEGYTVTESDYSNRTEQSHVLSCETQVSF